MASVDAGWRPVIVTSGGRELSGILHFPEREEVRAAVLVVVGGRQYRVGSHRFFVQLARDLVADGVAVLRFDLPGMGDSEGEEQDFLATVPDIVVAAEALRATVGVQTPLWLWGLCDGATSAIRCAGQLAPAGVVLANPWIYTPEGREAVIGRYYGQRLNDPVFWSKVRRFDLTVLKAMGSWLMYFLRRALWSREGALQPSVLSLPQQFARDLQAFKGEVLLLTSGRDATAEEFLWSADVRAAIAGNAARGLRHVHLAAADHTFSNPQDKGRVIDLTLQALSGPEVR